MGRSMSAWMFWAKVAAIPFGLVVRRTRADLDIYGRPGDGPIKAG